MENNGAYNEKMLIDLVSTGCEQSFTTLFNHHRNRVYSIAYKLLQSPAAAEEIVHDVFLQIWLKRDHLSAINNFSVYLFVVTRNHCYKALKQMARAYLQQLPFELQDAEAGEEVLTTIARKEDRLVLRNGIDRLPQQQQKVFRLIMEDGLKRKEVADLLHIKPETIKYHLAEAMKNLRKFCSVHLDFFLLALSCCFLGKK